MCASEGVDERRKHAFPSVSIRPDADMLQNRERTLKPTGAEVRIAALSPADGFGHARVFRTRDRTRLAGIPENEEFH
jgi:hypothetical protein